VSAFDVKDIKRTESYNPKRPVA